MVHSHSSSRSPQLHPQHPGTMPRRPRLLAALAFTATAAAAGAGAGAAAAAAAAPPTPWHDRPRPGGEGAGGTVAQRTWVTMNDTNACPGSASHPPTSSVTHGVPTAAACRSKCESAPTCDIFAWSPNSHSCYFRLDHTWAPGSPNDGYVSGCVVSGEGAVFECGYDPKTAPCPSSTSPPATPPPPAPESGCPWQVSAAVGNKIAETSEDFRMLGVNFDFWPASKSKWGQCGVLNSQLSDPALIAITSRLNGSLLRIGGSPADFMVYDVFDGACSKSNLNRTQPADGSFQPKGYFCPIWDQVPGQCLTMERWHEINAFASASGLKIAFDLNACWGRSGPVSSASILAFRRHESTACAGAQDGEMDFSMISGLFNITARMAKAGTAAVYGFQFGNELYSQVSPTRYAQDMLHLKQLLAEAWRRSVSCRTRSCFEMRDFSHQSPSRHQRRRCRS